MNHSLNNNTKFLLDCTNDFLIKMNAPIIEENPCFSPSEFNHPDHMKFKASSEKSISLRVEFDGYGAVFGLEELDEVYEWSFDDVESRRDDYEIFLENIIFCEIKIKRCAFGFNYVFVKNGDLWIDYGRVFNGFFALILFPLSYTPFCCKANEYHPILAKK